jgi:hypothetical protein
MYNYYCEVLRETDKFPKGIYTFEIDSRYGDFGRHMKLVQQSHWVIKEAEDRIVWIKNRLKPCPDLLTQDELKKFMWDKLQAKDIN